MDPGQGYIRHDLAVGPDRDSPTTQAAIHLLRENLAPVYGPWLRFQQWDPKSGELKMLHPQQSAPPWPTERHLLWRPGSLVTSIACIPLNLPMNCCRPVDGLGPLRGPAVCGAAPSPQL